MNPKLCRNVCCKPENPPRENAALIRLAVRRETVEFVDVFNAMLGARKSLAHDDFVKDGLHLSEKGYETWIEVITPWLEGAVGRR